MFLLCGADRGARERLDMASYPVPRRLLPAALLATAALAAPACGRTAPPVRPDGPPALLSATGLYLPDAVGRVDPRNLPYRPRFPLWTDGVAKRRWIHLPAGAAIDGTSPDAWRLPPGTRLWKEFASERILETRMLECAPDGTWTYATYLWREDGSDADLVESPGHPAAARLPDGVPYDVPSRGDCRGCHESGRGPVLGFTAFQLARPAGRLDDDGVSLDDLVARGLLHGHPAGAVHPLDAPSVAPRTRDVLGYLEGNCAHCHNAAGVLRGLGLTLSTTRQEAPGAFPAVRTSLGVPLRGAAGPRIDPGRPDTSGLLRRMASRVPHDQMPPVGTHRVDADALDLIASWIREDLAAPVRPLPTPSSENRP